MHYIVELWLKDYRNGIVTSNKTYAIVEDEANQAYNYIDNIPIRCIQEKLVDNYVNYYSKGC
jgi:hypothetical protein